MTTKKNSDPNFATARAPKPPASHEDEDISNGDLVWGFMNSTRPGELQWSPGVVISSEHKMFEILKYEVLWPNGTIEKMYRHEISLPHEPRTWFMGQKSKRG